MAKQELLGHLDIKTTQRYTLRQL